MTDLSSSEFWTTIVSFSSTLDLSWLFWFSRVVTRSTVAANWASISVKRPFKSHPALLLPGAAAVPGFEMPELVRSAIGLDPTTEAERVAVADDLTLDEERAPAAGRVVDADRPAAAMVVRPVAWLEGSGRLTLEGGPMFIMLLAFFRPVPAARAELREEEDVEGGPGR